MCGDVVGQYIAGGQSDAHITVGEYADDLLFRVEEGKKRNGNSSTWSWIGDLPLAVVVRAIEYRAQVLAAFDELINNQREKIRPVVGGL